MAKKPGLTAWIGEVLTLLRFAIVGASATLVYLATSFALEYWTRLAPQLVNAIAMGVSLMASYLGHYYFTYRKAGEGTHARHSTRFVIATIGLLALTVLVQHLSLRFLDNAYASYVLVSVFYPVTSVIVHHFITFRRGQSA